jgi:small-conductance mechanosensitive channel
VGLKTTRLRSITGERIVVSNAELLKSRIRNFRGQQERRVLLALNLPLDTPPAALAGVPAEIREIVGREESARFDRSHFSAITDQALVVETVYFITSGDYALFMDVQQRVNLAVLERLGAMGLALSPPPRVVLLRGDGAAGPPAGVTAEAPPAGAAAAAG